jgi:hypothetical protein
MSAALASREALEDWKYRRPTGTDWHDLFALPREPGIRGPLPKSVLFVKAELLQTSHWKADS